MSKKKRYRRPNVPRTVGQVNGQSGALSSATGNSGLDQDYSHIVRDLKRILVIAGTLIVGLIILSFILN